MFEDLISNPDVNLNGLDVEKTSELMGYLNALTPPQRVAAIRKIANNGAQVAQSQGSRGEMLKRMAMLPKEVQAALQAKRAQLVDARYYAAKAAGANTTIKLFKSDDDKSVGETNVANAKLDSDTWFLCSGIILLSGVDATPDVKKVAFDVVPAAIRNGEFTFRADSKNLVPEGSAAEVFCTTNRSTTVKGLFTFENPKLIEPQKEIQFNLELAEACAANTFIKAILVGTAVIPY